MPAPIWTEDRVEARLRAAAKTLRLLPEERVQGYFSTWPTLMREPAEILRMTPEPQPFHPLPEDIDEMDEVLRVWLRWLSVRQRRIVWLRAEKVRWKVIAAQLHCDRGTAWRQYRMALAVLAGRLNGRGQQRSGGATFRTKK